MKCPRCKKENDEKSVFCTHCGYAIKKASGIHKKGAKPTVSGQKPPASRFIQISSRLLRLVPFNKRIEGFMELDRLGSIKPAMLSLPVVATFLLGIMQSRYGHIENTPFLFQLMPIISCFNPFLGFLSALTFSIGDFIQKLVWDDVYYSGAKTMEDFVGARIGYLVAYMSVFVYGLLPGILARVFQRRVQKRGPSTNTLGWRVSNLTLLGTNIPVPYLSLAGVDYGAEDHSKVRALALGSAASASGAVGGLASMLAFAIGGALGSAIAGAAAIALELPAFYFRPNVDVSCANAMIQNNISQSIPNSAVTGGVGGGVTTLIRPPGTSEEPPEEPEEEEEEEEEESDDSEYRIRLTVDKNKIKGNGRDSALIRAEIIGGNGEVVPGQINFAHAPMEGGILNVSGNQATLIGAPLLKSVAVTVTCTAFIKGTESWFGIQKTPPIDVPSKQVNITVVGASPSLKLAARSQSLRGDGEPASCTIVNALILLFEEDELLPEEIAWELAQSLITGKVHPGAHKSIVRVCPEFSEKDGVLTLTARASFKLPPLPEVLLTESVSFDVRGANPKLDLTASPQKIFGDGEEYTIIKGECVMFGEKHDVDINFHETDKGALERVDRKTVKLTPGYTETDDSIKIVADATVGQEDNPILLEKSVTVEVVGVKIELVVSPEEVDADEVSQVKLSMDPEDSPNKMDIEVSINPGDAGKLSSTRPTCYFTPFLSGESLEVEATASISKQSKKTIEKRKNIRLNGASPHLELRSQSQSVKGDGETSIRIDARVQLFGKEATESKLSQLNAKVEWSHENPASSEGVGDFTSKQLTYAEFMPEATIKDKQVKITAKLSIVSAETGRVVEAESEPIIVTIKGANPELKLEAAPQTLPGAKITIRSGEENENYSVLKAKLIVFGEERAIPENSTPRFDVQETSLGLVKPHEEPSQGIFEPGFVARHRDTGILSQTAHIKASVKLLMSDIFPTSTGSGEVQVTGKGEIEVIGCLIKIVEPGPNTGAKAVDGLMFQLRAVVTTQSGDLVPGQTVNVAVQDNTKEKAEAKTAQIATNRRGEAVYSYTYSGAAASRSGAIQVTAEIRGGNQTRDYDTVSVGVTQDYKPLTLELVPRPAKIPGARMLSNERLVESLIETRIQGPDKTIDVPASCKVDFTLEDPDLGELEGDENTSVKFKPDFMARDLDKGKIDDYASVKGKVDVSLSQVKEKIPSYSWSSETIHLESGTRVNIMGCVVKILEPKDGQNLSLGDRGVVAIKATVSTPQTGEQVGDTVSGVDVKFTLTEKRGEAEGEPIEETVKTDLNGEAKLEHVIADAEKEGISKLAIKAEITGVRDTYDWDEVTVNILTGLTLTMTVALTRVRGDRPEPYSPQADANYTASRVIKLEEKRGE